MVTVPHTETHETPRPDYSEQDTPRGGATQTTSFRGRSCDRLQFWKVTSIGLCIGLTLGAGLGIGIVSFVTLPLADWVVYLMAALAMGLIGSILGAHTIRKRQPTEKIELFLNYSTESISTDKTPAKAEPKQNIDNSTISPFMTMAYIADGDGLVTDTYERGQVLSAGRKALLGMDHTKTTAH